MLSCFRCLCGLGAVCILALQPLSAEPQNVPSQETKTRLLRDALGCIGLSTAESGEGLKLSSLNIPIKDCDGFPYNEPLGSSRAACGILKEDELWSQHNSPYRQMRLWHQEGYDRLKTRMHSNYDA